MLNEFEVLLRETFYNKLFEEEFAIILDFLSEPEQDMLMRKWQDDKKDLKELVCRFITDIIVVPKYLFEDHHKMKKYYDRLLDDYNQLFTVSEFSGERINFIGGSLFIDDFQAINYNLLGNKISTYNEKNIGDICTKMIDIDVVYRFQLRCAINPKLFVTYCNKTFISRDLTTAMDIFELNPNSVEILQCIENIAFSEGSTEFHSNYSIGSLDFPKEHLVCRYTDRLLQRIINLTVNPKAHQEKHIQELFNYSEARYHIAGKSDECLCAKGNTWKRRLIEHTAKFSHQIELYRSVWDLFVDKYYVPLRSKIHIIEIAKNIFSYLPERYPSVRSYIQNRTTSVIDSADFIKMYA